MTSLQDLITEQGYFGVFVAMLIENFVQFIPSEAIMPFAGFLVSQGKLGFLPTALAGTIGTVLGTLPWYLIGRIVNEEKLEAYIDRHGVWFGLSTKKLRASRRWFHQHGNAIVFWGRLVPILRTVVSIPAGIELMPIRPFLLWTTLGSAIWNILLTYAGLVLGKNWGTLHEYMKPFSIVAALIIVASVVFLAWKSVKR